MASTEGGGDWFERAYDLKVGERAGLSYGDDFEGTDVELLELPPELLSSVQSGEETLCFKGGPDEEAVLCTKDRTYAVKRVETSNTVLILQPTRGFEHEVDDEVDDEERAGKRPRSDAPDASGEEPCAKRLTAFAQAASHLELVPTAPRLDAMWDRLLSDRHVFAGADVDKASDDAWLAANVDDADVGEEGLPDPPPRGFAFEELVETTQASEGEILAALEDGPAFEFGGRWRGMDPGYLDHLLDVTVVTAQAEGWELTRIPEGKMVDALAADGFPAAVTQHGLRTYFVAAGEETAAAAGGGGGEGTATAGRTLWCVDAARVCRAKASQLLDSAPGGGGGGPTRWRLTDFIGKWRDALPEDLKGACDEGLLKGLALVERAADGGDGLVRPYRADRLSKVPKERFQALFALKPRWTRDELEPYVNGLLGMTVEAALLKFTRVSQPTANAVPVYSKR